MTSTYGSYRVGPVICPECRMVIARLSNLMSHLTWRHPGMTTRERALAKDEARFKAGWFAKEPKRTWA